MGNLFYRGVSPAEIKAMKFKELRYWSDWHEVIEKAKSTYKCKKHNIEYDGRKGGCPACEK